MATGAEVRSSAGEAYAVLAEARAAPGARRDEDSAQALSRMGLAGREVLERKGRYVIYREAPAKTRSTAGVTLRLTGAGYPVLLNKQTGNLAVVTGNLRVKLKSGDITAVASAHGLTVTQEFTHLGTAFLSAPEGADLLALLAALRADPRIAEADLELFEHVRVPH